MMRGVRTDTVYETIKEVARLIQEYGGTKVLVEENINGGFASQLTGALAVRGYPMICEQVSHGGGKKGVLNWPPFDRTLRRIVFGF